MARPKDNQPTPGELEILKILWQDGPATVRDVMARLSRRRPRAYTSVMSLMNVMADKGLLARRPQGRAFLYEPLVEREATLGGLVHDLVRRAFGGSTRDLVTRLLDATEPTPEELKQIREVIDRYGRDQGAS